MPGAVIVRAAVATDAAAMALLRQASIRTLCGADHGNVPATMDSWVGDSSPAKFTKLFQNPGVTLIVAEIEAVITGLGGLSGDLVTLNYVHPLYRFGGISKALMHSLEQTMRDQGIGLGRLNSTATALRFYRAIGWVDAGTGTAEHGYPMQKRL